MQPRYGLRLTIFVPPTRANNPPVVEKGVILMTTVQDVEEFMNREVDAVKYALSHIDPNVEQVVQVIKECRGRVIFSGVGKTGHIGKKLAATFASLGTPAFFVHAVEAMHGDLGMITEEDIVVFISNSGETRETLAPIPAIRSIGALIVSISCSPSTSLAKASDIALTLPVNGEADDLGLAPSNSSTEVLVLGDAIALTIARQRGFTRQDFAKYHPGGALGKQLLKEKSMP